MLPVLLTVLKIIGIVLLSVIGLVLLLLLVVLFVPIRYKLYAKKTDEENDNIKADGKITWLLHLINVKISYPSEELLRVRIFLFKIFPKKQKDADTLKASKEKKKKSNKNDEVNKEDQQEQQNNKQDGKQDNTLTDETLNHVQEAVSETIDESYNGDEEEKETLKGFFSKVIDIIKNIKEKVQKVIDKISDIKNNVSYYLNVISSNAFNHSLSLCKKALLKILKALRPRKIKGYLNFGAAEPSTTAQVFGIYTLIAPYIGKKFHLYPFLEEETLEGEVILKGHIRIITLVVVGIKVYFNKDVKRTIKMFKKET